MTFFFAKNSDTGNHCRQARAVLFFSGLSMCVVLNGCGKQESKPPRPSIQVGSNRQYGAAQNDPEGYDGMAWGSAPDSHTVRELEAGGELQPLLNKVFGAPGTAQKIGRYRGDPRGELFFEAYEVGTPKFDYKIDHITGTSYLYYQTQLALIISRLHNYERAESKLNQKYSEAREIGAGSWGDASDEALALAASRLHGIWVGKVYKRGATNTRIYLLQHMIDGFKRDVFLVYIPGEYFSAIHDEWWDNFRHTEQQSAKESETNNERMREADQQKIQ